MICPSFPQEDYKAFSAAISEAIRADRCEHVWAEVINLRPSAISRTVEALARQGLQRHIEMLMTVHAPGAKDSWEFYAKETFLAHTRNIPPQKLRFLQYITPTSAGWWIPMRAKGAVLLGKAARHLGVAGVNGSIG